MRLYEKYRPCQLDQVVGQDKAVATIRRTLERSGAGGTAWWITGISGCGKTTLARIIAGSIADDWMTYEFDSGADLTMSELNRVLDSLSLCGAGKGGRAVIVNESHSLRADVLDKLKGVLERIPKHVTWVFTTTKEDEAQLFGDHIGAAQLLSRCFPVPLTNQGTAQAFAARALEIARGESLDGQPIEAYVKLARKHKNNFRSMLMDIEGGVMLEAQ